MNSTGSVGLHRFLDANKEKLAHSVLVFGAAGLAFYAVLFVGSCALKYSMNVLGFQTGMGL
jgi:hypothetical protein